jgi:hypothetical protein
VSSKLLEDLEEIKHEKVLLSQIGTTLGHHVPQFRIYQTYLENYDRECWPVPGLFASHPRILASPASAFHSIARPQLVYVPPLLLFVLLGCCLYSVSNKTLHSVRKITPEFDWFLKW